MVKLMLANDGALSCLKCVLADLQERTDTDMAPPGVTTQPSPRPSLNQSSVAEHTEAVNRPRDLEQLTAMVSQLPPNLPGGGLDGLARDLFESEHLISEALTAIRPVLRSPGDQTAPSAPQLRRVFGALERILEHNDAGLRERARIDDALDQIPNYRLIFPRDTDEPHEENQWNALLVLLADLRASPTFAILATIQAFLDKRLANVRDILLRPNQASAVQQAFSAEIQEIEGFLRAVPGKGESGIAIPAQTMLEAITRSPLAVKIKGNDSGIRRLRARIGNEWPGCGHWFVISDRTLTFVAGRAQITEA